MTKPTNPVNRTARVLLFVQHGAGPIKYSAASRRTSYRDVLRDYAETCGCTRWWLVECENAEAGRKTIAAEACDAKGGHYFVDRGEGVGAHAMKCRCGFRLDEHASLGRILDSRVNA